MGSEIIIIPAIFIGLPWVILHYVTRWKTAATLSGDDEKMIEELHDLARRCADRVDTVERIVAAENPAWRSLAADSLSSGIEDRIDNDNLRRIK